MSEKLSLNAAYRRIVKGPGSLKLKLKALRDMSRPSRNFLQDLARAPSSHPKIRALAVKRLAELEGVRSAAPPAKPCSVGSNAERPATDPGTGQPPDGQAALWRGFLEWRSRPAKVETVQKTDDTDRTHEADLAPTGSQPEAPAGIVPDGGNALPDRSIACRAFSQLAGEPLSEPPAEKAVRVSVETRPAERVTEPETKPNTEVAPRVIQQAPSSKVPGDGWPIKVRIRDYFSPQPQLDDGSGGIWYGLPICGQVAPEPKPIRFHDSFADQSPPPRPRQEPEFSKLDDAAGDLRRGILAIRKEIAEGKFEG